MTKLRVVVAEDSLTVRKRLVDVLSRDEEIQVVGEAEDGRRAIELCQSLHPDVITIDMMMPVMNGLSTTEYIMAYCPTPILIVSASVNRGELFKTYDALKAGAVDVLDKPSGTEPDDHWEMQFLSTVKLVARVKVITHLRARLNPPRRISPPMRPEAGPLRVVAIGASTGGPGALVEILKEIPASFPLPILLVIHIGKAFGGAFAEWLSGYSRVPVSYAQHGQRLPTGGSLLMAPPDRHLVLREETLSLSDAPERHSCRPSVDVLFESIAQDLGRRSMAFLLTGMGRDGAEGMLAIRQAGGATIAQDESTSTVFGMPHEAIKLGGAERVLTLPQIAATLAQLGDAR